jgi:NAD(P)-dependent dehydrogenase (short-subunit alcohol dehydrogenase family)
MSKVFITGSADGLGQLAAQRLVAAGNEVLLHARNENRGREALAAVMGGDQDGLLDACSELTGVSL